MKEVSLLFRKRLMGEGAAGGAATSLHCWCLCMLVEPLEKQFGNIHGDLTLCVCFSLDNPVIPLLVMNSNSQVLIVGSQYLEFRTSNNIGMIVNRMEFTRWDVLQHFKT